MAGSKEGGAGCDVPGLDIAWLVIEGNLYHVHRVHS